jgi:hypothetical protein
MFLNLREQVRRAPTDEATVERLLAYLPLSPLEILRADMQLRRYEILIPARSFELHLVCGCRRNLESGRPAVSANRWHRSRL